MDRKSLQNPEILRLLDRSAAARSVLRSEVDTLKQRLNVTGRLRDSLRSKPSSWLLGSTAAGIAAGILFPRFRRRTPTSAASRSKNTTLRLIGMAWSAAQPLVKLWIANQLRSWLAHRTTSPVSYPSPRNHPR